MHQCTKSSQSAAYAFLVLTAFAFDRNWSAARPISSYLSAGLLAAGRAGRPAEREGAIGLVIVNPDN